MSMRKYTPGGCSAVPASQRNRGRSALPQTHQPCAAASKPASPNTCSPRRNDAAASTPSSCSTACCAAPPRTAPSSTPASTASAPLNPNEIRQLEDLNPYDGGARYRVPLNMTDPAAAEDNDDQEATHAAPHL